VTRRVAGCAAALLAVALLLTGCQSGDPEAGPSGSTTPSSPTPARATEPPRPDIGLCYRLSYHQAIAPTTHARHVDCRKTYSARTFHVGTLDAVVDGHLLTVDSRPVQDDIAAQCTRRVGDYLGGTADDLALSMFRVIWFSPTVQQSEAGQDWYRCDVIALAREGELVRLQGPLEGALRDGLDRWGTCGTAEPGSRTFERVVCSATRSWRAIAVVRHRGSSYPGPTALTGDRSACEDPARAAADDPLKVVFSYLAPTREQWRAGQHYGTCWVPTSDRSTT